jgi:hypothetical protein
MKDLSYYERNAYFTTAKHALENGDKETEIVVMPAKNIRKYSSAKPLLLIFAGSFVLDNKKFVEGVIRIEPMSGSARAACREAGDNIVQNCYDYVSAKEVFDAIASFVPSRDGSSIMYPAFPAIDYSYAAKKVN